MEGLAADAELFPREATLVLPAVDKDCAASDGVVVAAATSVCAGGATSGAAGLLVASPTSGVGAGAVASAAVATAGKEGISGGVGVAPTVVAKAAPAVARATSVAAVPVVAAPTESATVPGGAASSGCSGATGMLVAVGDCGSKDGRVGVNVVEVVVVVADVEEAWLCATGLVSTTVVIVAGEGACVVRTVMIFFLRLTTRTTLYLVAGLYVMELPSSLLLAASVNKPSGTIEVARWLLDLLKTSFFARCGNDECGCFGGGKIEPGFGDDGQCGCFEGGKVDSCFGDDGECDRCICECECECGDAEDGDAVVGGGFAGAFLVAGGCLATAWLVLTAPGDQFKAKRCVRVIGGVGQS